MYFSYVLFLAILFLFVYVCIEVPTEARKGRPLPWNRDYMGGYELPFGCWDLDSGPAGAASALNWAASPAHC